MKKEMYKHLKMMDESSHWWYRARRSILDFLAQKYLPQNRKLKILDIGCGVGSEFDWLQKYGEVFGVDPDRESVQYSKSRVSNPDAITIGSLPTDIQYDISFNWINALDVIEHVQEDLLALHYINRNLLKPSGFLFVTVPAFQFLWSPHDEINLHRRRYTRAELKNKLEKAGFKVIKISYYNTFLSPLIVIIKIFSRFLWGKKPAAHADRPVNPIINSVCFFIFNLEKHFIKIINFPFGISLLAIAQKPES